jgi:hypothetical protein
MPKPYIAYIAAALAVVALVGLWSPGRASAHDAARAAVTPGGPLLAADAPAREPGALPRQRQVDQHDDSRVEVQLIVLGAAAVTVVVVGTAAYLLRRRLGLTAYDPKEAEAKMGH